MARGIRQLRRGQMMVELMVGITVITLSMGALFLLMARSIAFTRAVSDEYIATYLAAEGIELIKSFVEANFKEARAYNRGFPQCAPGYEIDVTDWSAQASCRGNPRFLNFDGNTGRYTYGAGRPTKFKRAVQVDWNAPGQAPYLLVTSTVRWQARDGEKTVVLKDIFYDLCNLRSSDPSQCPI